MANDNQHNELNQSGPAQPAATGAGLDARGASRRRFARAGAGATGVLLTLASHPGMACSIKVGPSGYQSVIAATSKGITLSHRPPAYSNGKPPSQWCNDSNWPCGQDKTFGSIFTCYPSNSKCGAATLKSHCAGTTGVTGDMGTICQLLSAAYLNVQAGLSPFLTQDVLHNIWYEYQSRQSYAPMAGVTPWNAVTIVAYLNGTMDGKP